MSPDTDRIVVPTNGKRPHPLPEPAAQTPAREPSSPAAVPPFTTTQLAVGFAILAAVVALAARSLRLRSRAGRRRPFGRR